MVPLQPNRGIRQHRRTNGKGGQTNIAVEFTENVSEIEPPRYIPITSWATLVHTKYRYWPFTRGVRPQVRYARPFIRGYCYGVVQGAAAKSRSQGPVPSRYQRPDGCHHPRQLFDTEFNGRRIQECIGNLRNSYGMSLIVLALSGLPIVCSVQVGT